MANIRLAAGLLCTVCLPLSAAAQQTIVLDPITLTAQENPSLGRVAVDPERLEAAATGSLKDVFAEEPSIAVGGGLTVTEQVFVNGISEQQLAVSVDGAAQNNRLFHHTGTNVIDPGLLKTARVDPGVAGADAGPGALAGSIAYETKSALDLLEPGRSYGGKVTTGYANNRDTATGAVTLYGRQGPVDALVYLRRDTGDDYEDGAGRTVRYSGADLTSGMVKLGAELGGWRAEYGAMRVEDDALRPYRANVGGVIGGRPTPETRRYQLEQTTQSLSLRRSGDSGLWNPEFRLSKSQSDVNTFELPTAETPDPDFNLGRGETVSALAQNRLQLGGAEITAGVDVQNRQGLHEGQFRGAINSFREDSHNTGLFAQARGSWRDIDYGVGLRHDWNLFSGAGGQTIDSDGTSVNASLSWHATEQLSVSAGYSSVFGGVPLASVYEFWTDNLEPGAYGAIRPTRAYNTIFGLAWDNGATSIGGDLFSTTISDARKGLTVREVEAEGYRLSLGQKWQSGSAMLRFTDTEIEVDGGGASSYDLRDLGMIPGRLLTLEARQDLFGGITVGGLVQHAFDEERQGVDTTRDFAGYTVADLFAEYSPAQYRQVTFRAEVRNLFDRQYVDRASYGGDYESVVGQAEPGRTLALTANLTF